MSDYEIQPDCVEHITRIYAWEGPAFQHINWWLKLKGHSFRYKSYDVLVYTLLYAYLKENRKRVALDLAKEAGIDFNFKEFAFLEEVL
jgi:hypothetical protein